MPRVPLSLVPERDDPLSIHVFADGTIGTEPLRFLIDTGARTCTVPLSSATEHLPSARRTTSLGAADSAMDGDEVIVPEIRVGELIATNVQADRTELGDHRHPTIGIDVLGKHRCSFRLDQSVLDIDAEPPPNADLHPLEEHPLGLPFVSVTFDDDTVQACWDTGASHSGVDLGWAQRHPHLVTIGNTLAGHDGVGAELEVCEAELAACSIGGVAFAASPCVVIDLAPINDRIGHSIEVVIGVPLIQQADWWFDFPRQLWAVQGLGLTQTSSTPSRHSRRRSAPQSRGTRAGHGVSERRLEVGRTAEQHLVVNAAGSAVAGRRWDLCVGLGSERDGFVRS